MTSLSSLSRTRVLVASALAALTLSAAPLAAQATGAKPPAKTGMEGMDHNAHMKAGAKEAEPSTGWKELDAYHMLMMATWHPAKQNGDMAPLKAKAKEMVASAKLLAASTPPKACATPKLKEAATNLAPQTQDVADMVAKGADNNALKDALKVLHDKFDVLEEGCSPMKHDMKH